MNRISKIYRPIEKVLDKTKNVAVAKNQNFFIQYGLMKPLNRGVYYYLPILQRSIDKTSNLISRFMQKVDAQKITMPILTPAELWKESKRYTLYEDVLFVTKDKFNHDLVLGPTFEEAITHMMTLSGGNIGEDQLPFRFYQIGSKFRDEESPRYGLVRSREFIMKDMYTFDVNKKCAIETYHEISDIYEKLFKFVGVPFTKVEADASDMGGHLSHEYHYMNSIGDERLLICSSCHHSIKENEETPSKCTKCNSTSILRHRGIEVGHTFYLGDTFTKCFNAHYQAENGKNIPMEMGCHGIGVTRLLGAAVECLSTDVHIRWPFSLVPFSICIVPPEKRSKAFEVARHYLDEIYQKLNAMPGIEGDIVVDDRIKLNPNERIRHAKRIGIPIIVIIGKKACDPSNVLFELYITEEDKTCFLPMNELLQEISKIVQNHRIEC